MFSEQMEQVGCPPWLPLVLPGASTYHTQGLVKDRPTSAFPDEFVIL